MPAKSREGTIHYHVQDETGHGPRGGAAGTSNAPCARAGGSVKRVLEADSTPESPVDSAGPLGVEPDSSVDEVVDAVRSWIESTLPEAWIEAGRRGGPAAVREVRTRADYESWYPNFGRSGLVAATWPRAYGGLDLSPAAARRVEEELRPFNLGRLNPLGSESGRSRPLRPRDRGAASPISPSDRPKRGSLVPALQRAWGRFGPRVPGHQGRAGRG